MLSVKFIVAQQARNLPGQSHGNPGVQLALPAAAVAISGFHRGSHSGRKEEAISPGASTRLPGALSKIRVNAAVAPRWSQANTRCRSR
jgi:hypothetical protein